MPETKTMVINMGPQHPSTHGVLRLVLELDGEVVVKVMPHIGYLHTGMEKIMESKRYQQAITVTDRFDYLAPMSNNLAFVLSVEKLLGIEVPERTRVIRVLLSEAIEKFFGQAYTLELTLVGDNGDTSAARSAQQSHLVRTALGMGARIVEEYSE